MALDQYTLQQVLQQGLSDPRNVDLIAEVYGNPFGFGWEDVPGFPRGENEDFASYQARVENAQNDYLKQLLPENLRNMQVAGKGFGAGDVGRLTQEFQYLMPKTKSLSAA